MDKTRTRKPNCSFSQRQKMHSCAILLLVALLFATASTSSDLPGWLVCTWPHSTRLPSSDALVRDFPVHAIQSNVVFVVGLPHLIPKLQERGFDVHYARVFDPTEQLYVVEYAERLAMEVEKSFGSRSFQQTLVWALFESRLAVIDNADVVEKASDLEWTSLVEVVPLRNQAIIPSPRLEDSPVSALMKRLEFNPLIGQVVAEVSSQELYNRLYDLSEGFYTRQSASPQIRETQAYLYNAFSSLGLKVFTHNYRSDYAENICADIEGELYPDLLVVTGAHYDSRSTNTNDTTLRAPGAVDNGSGTAGMLEMARVLVKSGLKFANTIRICVWTGEEQGLLGSDAYAKKIKAEGATVLAYFNADMTGYQLPGTQITLGMKDRTITEWLLDLSYNITATYVPGLRVALSSSCCSDYISFYNQGYPSIGYFQNAGGASDYPDYHKSTDTIDKNNFVQMKMETQAVLAAVMTFAMPRKN